MGNTISGDNNSGNVLVDGDGNVVTVTGGVDHKVVEIEWSKPQPLPYTRRQAVISAWIGLIGIISGIFTILGSFRITFPTSLPTIALIFGGILIAPLIYIGFGRITQRGSKVIFESSGKMYQASIKAYCPYCGGRAAFVQNKIDGHAINELRCFENPAAHTLIFDHTTLNPPEV